MLEQDWRSRRRPRRRRGRWRTAGDGEGPRPLGRTRLDDGFQAAVGGDRGPDGRPARRPLRPRAAGSSAPAPSSARAEGERGGRQPARAVQPGRPGLRARRTALHRRHGPDHGPPAERRRAADGDGLRRPACRAPTASRSTAVATSGSPTAGPAQGRVWRIGSDACPQRSSASSRWPTTRCPAESAATCAACRPGRSRSPSRRQAANTLGSQHLVANGLAFGRNGTLYVADTARGAIWRVSRPPRRPAQPDRLRHDLRAEHAVPGRRPRPAPLPRRRRRDRARPAGNIFVAANERNAVAVVSTRAARRVFRNSPRPPGCATPARSSSRPARSWSAASCAVEPRRRPARQLAPDRRRGLEDQLFEVIGTAEAGGLLEHLPGLGVEAVQPRRVDVQLDAIADRERRARRDVALADVDRALAGLLDPGDQHQQRRLAAAGWADQHHELALGDSRAERRRPRADRSCRPSIDPGNAESRAWRSDRHS